MVKQKEKPECPRPVGASTLSGRTF